MVTLGLRRPGGKDSLACRHNVGTVDPVKRRKPKAERKELVLRIRLTAEQKERLEAAAKEVGSPVSTWLLGLGLRAATKKADGGGKP